jgi:hypothetical protein
VKCKEEKKNFFFVLKNFIILFFSLRDFLTAMGKPDERLSDVEVINKNIFILLIYFN